MTYFFLIKNEATKKKKCNDFEFPYANSLDQTFKDQISRKDGQDTYPQLPQTWLCRHWHSAGFKIIQHLEFIQLPPNRKKWNVLQQDPNSILRCKMKD